MRPVTSSVAVGLGGCVLVALLGAACTASGESVRPPSDQFVFPTGMAITPDDSLLFVANANSELRYDSGSVLPVDLDVVDQVANAWVASGTKPDGCTRDADHTESLICDEAMFLRPDAAVRIGNFATDVGVQDTGNGTFRLILPVRGDPSITWVDWDGSKLNCAGTAEGFSLCDDAHRLSAIHGDPSIGTIAAEPFGVFADSTGQFAIVTHLTTGAITLVDSRPGADAEIADVLQNAFLPDPTTGVRGSTGVAGRSPGSLSDMVYVGSRSEDRIQTVTVGRPVNDAPPYLLQGAWFFLDFIGGNSGSSSDTRGMAFSPSGNRLYTINREPPTLQIFDTSPGPDGFPQNRGVGGSDICRQASTVSVMDSGDGERAYLTCFQDGEMYVVDPRGTSQVTDIVTVGRGPYAIATAATRKKVYVSNFLEDTVSVIDAAPGSPTRDRVVLRMGVSKSATATGTP